jgi:hypothetical protein
MSSQLLGRNMGLNENRNEETMHGQLRCKGFSRTYMWEDAPNTFYADILILPETALHVRQHGRRIVKVSAVMSLLAPCIQLAWDQRAVVISIGERWRV